MALNITLTGEIYDTNGTAFTGTEVRYWGYFHHVNGGSSTSTWDGSVRTSELGYYNINLGDGSWLTQTGNAGSGDYVTLLFWTPNTISDGRTATTLTQWGLYDIQLTSNLVYVQDIQIKAPMVPYCDFSRSGGNTVSTNVIISDDGAHDIHSWTFDSYTFWQRPYLHSQLMFGQNELDYDSIDSIEIDWDDTSTNTEDIHGTSYIHQYTAPDDYTITSYVTNVSGLSCNQTFPLRVYWRTPIPQFIADDWTPNPQGCNNLGDSVLFTNTSTDPDGQAEVGIGHDWTLDWYMADGTFSADNDGEDWSDTQSHVFHSPSIHNVEMCINWWDGFNWQATCVDHNINQQVWSTPTPDFTADDWIPDPQGETGLGNTVTFTNISNDPNGRRTSDSWFYDWNVSDEPGGHSINHDAVIHTYSPTHNFHSPGNHNVQLEYHWCNGFSWYTQDITKQIDQQEWEVLCGLNWTTPIIINVPHTYTPNITGDTGHIHDVDYEIDTTPMYTGLAYNTNVLHTFTVSTTHYITQIMNLHNGFNMTTPECTFTITMGSVANFHSVPADCGLTFISDSIPGTPPITLYRWRVYDNDTDDLLAELSESDATEFYYAWPFTGTFRIEHYIMDSGSSGDTASNIYTITECPSGSGSCPECPECPEVTRDVGLGSGGPYAKPYYTEDKDEKDCKKIIIVAEYLHKRKHNTRKVYYKKRMKKFQVKAIFKGIREIKG